jgi:transcription initiation factor TFIIB
VSVGRRVLNHIRRVFPGRTFANDEGGADPSRVGGPTNALVDTGAEFSTVVSSKDGNTGIARDLQRTAQRTNAASGHMRNLPLAFQDIDAMCDSISLPRTVADVAKQLFKRADDERLLRGKQITAIIAACIFIACRQAGPGIARSFKEIVALTGVSKKLLGQCFKVLAQSFETEGTSRSHTPSDTLPPSTGGTAGAEDLMIRFCNHLGLPVPIQLRAIDIVRKCTSLGLLDGRSPMSVAGACILFATHLFNQPKTAREISAVAGVSDATIRNAYK